MKKLNSTALLIGLIIIGCIVGMVINQTTCSDNITLNDTIEISDTIEIFDTIPYYDTIPVKPASIIIYVDIPANVDTAEILKKYFAHVFRDDTLKNDSNIFIRLEQEITENDVIKQILEIHDFENTMVITKEVKITTYIPAPKLYIGAFAIFSEDCSVIGGKLVYKTPKDIFFSAGYGSKKTIYVDVSVPINKLFTKKK